MSFVNLDLQALTSAATDVATIGSHVSDAQAVTAQAAAFHNDFAGLLDAGGLQAERAGMSTIPNLVLAQGMPALPPAREFLMSAGFAGAAALAAAVLVAVVVVVVSWRSSKRHRGELAQRHHHHQDVRDDQRRAGAAAACWQRFVWVVETAGIEPLGQQATLGLGPELTLDLLRGLLLDARALGEDTIVDAVATYQSQFALVLAQQGGLFTDSPPDATTAAPDEQSDPPPAEVDAAAPPVTEKRAAAGKVTVGAGRPSRQ